MCTLFTEQEQKKSYIGLLVTYIFLHLEGRNKPNTLYKHIRILQEKNLVEVGAKVERANGYFLNEQGLEMLKKFDDMGEKEI